jgi:hypothetical protein
MDEPERQLKQLRHPLRRNARSGILVPTLCVGTEFFDAPASWEVLPVLFFGYRTAGRPSVLTVRCPAEHGNENFATTLLVTR